MGHFHGTRQDEGPCLEGCQTGRPVAVERLDHAQRRWPRFAPAALKLRFGSVLAVPMRLQGQVIGGLNLFGEARTDPFDALAIPIAQALADVATIAVLQDRLARQRDLVDQLQHALNSRVTIEQAKGVLATRLDIGTDEAFRLLRDRARDDRRRLRDLAEDVVSTRAEADWSRYHPRA